MQNIRYIGKKQQKVDTVAGTGVIWNGNGDVQPVPDKAAGKLLEHTDSWELATDVPPAAADKLESAAANAEMIEVEKKDEPTLVNLATMDKEALRTYAQQNFGHAFHPKTGEAKMRDAIIGLMNRG